jgi:hypothetical protein
MVQSGPARTRERSRTLSDERGSVFGRAFREVGSCRSGTVKYTDDVVDMVFNWRIKTSTVRKLVY